MIPAPYIVSEVNGYWRVQGPSGWWVDFKTRGDAEELWQTMRYYLDQPPKASDIN